MTAGLKLSQVFPAMKRDLMEHGWHQGALFRDIDGLLDYDPDGGVDAPWDPRGPRCLDGSRQVVCQYDYDLEEEVDDVMGLLATRNGYRDFVDFNDDVNTTFNMITAFLDDCELEAKERERNA